jgi:hypothetical protein
MAVFRILVTGQGERARFGRTVLEVPMLKKVVELLLCFLHPLAVILMWINLATRTDIGTGAKIAWAIFGLIPLVPFLYVLTGGDLF